MSDITDVVKALTELASALRSAAKHAAEVPLSGNDDDRYHDGKVTAYHDAAGMVDAVMVGPAIQAALDELDRKEYRDALRGL